MLPPANRTINISAGGTALVGRTTAVPTGGAGGGGGGSGMPAWLAGAALNQWVAIPNTSGAGGAGIEAYSGFTVRDDTNEIFVLLAGGHGKGLDNRVTSLPLGDDSPAWVLRKAASTNTASDASYYPDGTPASVHTYTSGAWIASRNRIMMHGSVFGFEHAVNPPRCVNGFNPDTNQWDPAGTWADIPSNVAPYTLCRGKNDEVWLASAGRWKPTTDTYDTYTWNTLNRFPGAYDSLRDKLFTIQWGDGQGYNPEYGLVASKISATGAQTPITFNPSAALTELVGLQGVYSGLGYDPINDKFYLLPGACIGVGGDDPNPKRVFIITPNSGTTWDISSYTPASGATPAVDNVASPGVLGRFRYVPGLKGFAFIPTNTSDVYFMRTSA